MKYFRMINSDLLADMLSSDDENLNYIHYLDRSKLGEIAKKIPGQFFNNTCIITDNYEIKEITVIPVIPQEDLDVYIKDDELVETFTIPGTDVVLANITY